MAMTLVETITLASATSTITFSNIPQTGKDIMVLTSLRDANTSSGNDVLFSVNGVTTGYVVRTLYGTGSGIGRANAGSSGYMATFSSQSNNLTANTFSNIQFYLSNYAGSRKKSVSIDAVTENNATAAYMTINAGLLNATAAITSLSISMGGPNFLQHSSASLYIIS